MIFSASIHANKNADFSWNFCKLSKWLEMVWLCVSVLSVAIQIPILVRGHPLSTYSKFSEKLTFLNHWYAHMRVRIRGLEMLVFRKNLGTYLMYDPLQLRAFTISAKFQSLQQPRAFTIPASPVITNKLTWAISSSHKALITFNHDALNTCFRLSWVLGKCCINNRP